MRRLNKGADFALVFVFVVCVVCGASAEDSVDVVATTILDLQKENRSQLLCGKIAWTTTLIDSHGATQRVEDHTMWWKGKLVARESRSEWLDEFGGWVKDHGIRSVFDGEHFRQRKIDEAATVGVHNRDSQPSAFSDWLKYISWKSNGATTLQLWKNGKLPAGTEFSCSVADGKDGHVASLTFTHDQGRVEEDYHLDRGGECTRVAHFRGDGTPIQQMKSSLAEISSGLWLPISVTWSSGKNGNRSQVALDKCIFNDPDSLPDSLFTIDIRPEQDILDHRAGSPPISYSGRAFPLTMVELCERQRSVIERPMAGSNYGPAILVSAIVITLVVCVWTRRRFFA